MDTLSKPEDIARQIMHYLKKYPDFFRDNPVFLRELNIPHQTEEGVSSLIERQVMGLRQQNQKLENELNSREIKAQAQQALLADTHQHSLDILQATDVHTLSHIVTSCIQDDFFASQVRLYVFSDQLLPEDTETIRFYGGNARLKRMFIELLNRNKPLCGSLQEEHVCALFGKDAATIHSTLIIPIIQTEWQGLLVLGSEQRGLYGHGYEQDMLVYLSTIIETRLQQLFSSVGR
jgi:uncharacterized protein